MRRSRSILRIAFGLFLLVALAFNSATAQENAEIEKASGTWVSDNGVYPIPDLILRYDRYSRADVTRFREMLEQLRRPSETGEWDGLYTYDFPDMVGATELRLKANTGFAEFYVYSCLPELRYLRYGKVVENADSIELVPELTNDSPGKSGTVTYVKASWGPRRYLVEESSLLSFAEKAAGIYADTVGEDLANDQKWQHYWVIGDLDKPLAGLPRFPERYKQFERQPVVARIKGVTRRTLGNDVKIGTSVRVGESAVYRLVLNAGSDQGVKRGLTFIVKSTGEEIFVTDVRSTSSSGILVRSLTAGNQDHCVDLDGEQTACGKLSRSMTVSTKAGNFWW